MRNPWTRHEHDGLQGNDTARGPRGEKHSADVIVDARVMGARIATREIEGVTDKTPNRAKGGKVGEKKRAEKLSKVERSIIARDAAIRRWSKRD